MSATAAAIAKAAAAILSDERGRKAVGWIIVAILSPVIVLIAVLCSLGTGSSDHNNAALQACFYGTALSSAVPAEYQTHINHMRTSFTRLDSAVALVNASAENGGLDATRVKAAFFVLCFGDDVPTNREAGRFVGCFYTTETRTREVEVEDEETGEITTTEEEYNQMYYTASESGPISTIPEIPGLAVWHDGHIGVYIGSGEVIEAMGTNYGVVKTQLASRGFTHWLKVAYINYD